MGVDHLTHLFWMGTQNLRWSVHSSLYQYTFGTRLGWEDVRFSLVGLTKVGSSNGRSNDTHTTIWLTVHMNMIFASTHLYILSMCAHVFSYTFLPLLLPARLCVVDAGTHTFTWGEKCMYTVLLGKCYTTGVKAQVQFRRTKKSIHENVHLCDTPSWVSKWCTKLGGCVRLPFQVKLCNQIVFRLDNVWPADDTTTTVCCVNIWQVKYASITWKNMMKGPCIIL